MSELMLDEPPLPGCSGERGRGGGVAAAEEARFGSALGYRGARREGAGHALRLRARLGAGLEQAWRDSRNKELVPSARSEARGGRARARAGGRAGEVGGGGPQPPE